jgi:hypothetical protein
MYLVLDEDVLNSFFYLLQHEVKRYGICKQLCLSKSTACISGFLQLKVFDNGITLYL